MGQLPRLARYIPSRRRVGRKLVTKMPRRKPTGPAFEDEAMGKVREQPRISFGDGVVRWASLDPRPLTAGNRRGFTGFGGFVFYRAHVRACVAHTCTCVCARV